jgi:hypothetical protein
MIEFIKRHEESGRHFEFYFREIYCSNAEKFFVLVRDNGRVVARFEMSKEPNKKWRVLAPAPQWIQDAETEIVTLLLSDCPPLRRLCQQYDAALNQQPLEVV